MDDGYASCKGEEMDHSGLTPFQASIPSRTARAAIPRAASGSAHHHPTVALSNSPTRRIADRLEHNSVSVESARITGLPSRRPTTRFAHASSGITTSETAASTIPTGDSPARFPQPDRAPPLRPRRPPRRRS
jgi:hypothetical protein